MEVSFNKPKYSTRCFAFLFDFMCVAIATCLLILATLNIMNNVPYYKEANEAINDIQYRSHLYVKREDGSYRLMCNHYVPQDEKEMRKYNSEFDQALIRFYSDEFFFDQSDPKSGLYLYNLQKIPENGQSDLFVYEDSSKTSIVPKTDAKVKDLYDFFCEAMSGQAVQYVANNDSYIENSRTISLTYIFIILLIPLVLSTTIFEYIIPLCLRRGKKTLGKLIFKIGVVDVHGLSCPFWKFTLRFILFLLVEVLLSIVTILIPFIISFSMCIFSSRGQSFHDYVTNTYVVEGPMNAFCLNAEEYKHKMEKEHNYTLEKEDVVL